MTSSLTADRDASVGTTNPPKKRLCALLFIATGVFIVSFQGRLYFPIQLESPGAAQLRTSESMAVSSMHVPHVHHPDQHQTLKTSANGTSEIHAMTPSTQASHQDAWPWPMLFMYAVGKAGSSALYDFLARHPQICTPNRQIVNPKEPIFFNGKGLKFTRTQLRSKLVEAFTTESCSAKRNRSNHVYNLDGSITYIHTNGLAASRIRAMLPEQLHPKVRFVLVLREPLSRDISFYNSRKFYTRQTYPEWFRRNSKIRYAKGQYDTQINELWQLWPRNQTLVLSYDSFKANETDTLMRIMDFLNLSFVSSQNATSQQLPRLNTNADPRKISEKDLDPEFCQVQFEKWDKHSQRFYRSLEKYADEFPKQQPSFPHFQNPCKR